MVSENSWQSEELPGDWKRQITMPIIKNGRKENAGNSQSVSLTSLPGKILDSPRCLKAHGGQEGDWREPAQLHQEKTLFDQTNELL